MSRSRLTIIFISLALGIAVGAAFYQAATRLPLKSYSEFLSDLENGLLTETSIRGEEVIATSISGNHYRTYAPAPDSLIDLLTSSPVTIRTHPKQSLSPLYRDMLLIMLLLGGWMILSKTAPSSTKHFLNGRNRNPDVRKKTGITFDDVAGISEASEELREIIDFLQHPNRYSRLGAQIPKGVLLEGPPGTGKTLLARAIAGEASVPFFSIGGSDFVELFAGMGASRVRKLFQEAKKQAPCIIFIDEIDAIGSQRSISSGTGASDEREQTLNALLVEMDGFETGATIIVVAATNRSDILDQALLRPGRFDRRISLTLPDIKGRVKILQVHSARTALGAGVDLSAIARSIPGFSGAEIANLVNEAALHAARNGKSSIEQADFEEAQDKIVMGLKRGTMVVNQETRRLTAYHEAAHALVAKMLPEADPLHKVTIIPRGRAMGHTQQLPIEDHLTYRKSYLLARIKVLLAGRLGEEIIFGTLTTGASNDLRAAADISYRLVCEFGMSRRLGPIARIDVGSGDVNNASRSWQQSQQSRREIDMEISRIINKCYESAKDLIDAHNTFLHMLAESLLVHEALDSDEVDIIYRCYLNQREVEEHQRRDRAVPEERR